MDVLYRMQRPGGNEDLIAGSGDDAVLFDGQFEGALQYGHEFVGRMDEVVPLAPRRVGELITAIAPRTPVAGDGAPVQYLLS